MSFADAFAAATALKYEAVLMTGDAEFKPLAKKDRDRLAGLNFAGRHELFERRRLTTKVVLLDRIRSGYWDTVGYRAQRPS